MIKTFLKRTWIPAALSLVLAAHEARAITLNFSSVPGATVKFTGTGRTFEFVDSTTVGFVGSDFRVTLSDGTGAPSVGLLGNIGGTFTIGAISISGPVQSAPVTGVGSFSIFDGSTSLTATAQWTTIRTFGTSGSINAGGSVNLSGISYSGSNPDLQALAASAADTGIAVVSFQFIPAKTLTQLTTAGAVNSTTYSGTVFVVSGAIGDFVWNDLDQNGIQDPGEPGIDGVTVTLKDNNGILLDTTVTASNGFYQFVGLSAGTYTVTVDTASPALTGMLASPVFASGSTPATDSNPNPETVTLATDTSSDQTIDFGFYAFVPPTGQIGDFVWKDLNQDGIQDPGEPGINGVTVTLKDGASNVIATTTTAGDGAYLFTGLGAGTYSVEVDTSSPALAGLMPTFENAGGDPEKDSNPNPATVVLATNSSVDLSVDFGYIPTPAGSIGDFVWQDLNGDGIQGNATDEPGIPGVTVQLLGPGDVVVATTTTDPDGYYLFTGLSAGTYKVVVANSVIVGGYTYNLTTPNSPGSNTTNDSNPNPATVILPLNTSSDTSVDFGYTPVPAGRIGDFVWKDLNGNGIQESGEPGIDGVTVTLLSSADAVLATTTTAGGGAYAFTGLSAGTYKVKVDTASPALAGFIPTAVNAPGSTTANDSNPNPATVTLPSNTSTDNTIDFGYILPSGKIGDFVWKDLNQNGIQDVGEPGINGVTVKLLGPGNVLLATTVTSGNGGYLFTGLSAGTYSIAVDNTSPALAGLIPTTTNAAGSTLANDSNPNPATVTLATHSSADLTVDFGYVPTPAGSIGDFVWKDLNGNGIQDSGEPGISGVTVRLYRQGNPVAIATATTDAGGLYLFSGLSAGTYSVAVDNSSAALTGYLASTPNAAGSTPANDSNPNPATVTLATNTSSNLTIDFGYTPCPAGKIGDFVWKDLNRNGIQDSGEPGINGVTVKLYGPGNVLLATKVTSGNGGYLFTGLSAGTYTVSIVNSQSALSGLSPTTTNAAGSNTSNDSNANPATVTLATNLSSDLTIDFGYKTPPACGPLITYTMCEWGASLCGSNPAAFLSKNFAVVYPAGLTVGGGFTLKFTSAKAIENFLPCSFPSGTTARALTQSYVNPTTNLGLLAGQVVALRINVDFSNAGFTPVGLTNAKFKSGKFAGKTVGYVLSLAESVLGGAPLPTGVSYIDLSDACALVNSNYDGGSNGGKLTP
jgi:hypothetical protein